MRSHNRREQRGRNAFFSGRDISHLPAAAAADPGASFIGAMTGAGDAEGEAEAEAEPEPEPEEVDDGKPKLYKPKRTYEMEGAKMGSRAQKFEYQVSPRPPTSQLPRSCRSNVPSTESAHSPRHS